MMTLSQLTEFFGWASVLNMGFLFLATLLLVALRPVIAGVHGKMFGIPESELSLTYFNYLANYKTLSLIFVVFPYFVLKVMG